MRSTSNRRLRASWLEQEHDGTLVARELRRLWLRARKRWWLTLSLTVVFAGLIVVRQAMKPRYYDASVTFRVAEAEKEEGAAPETKRELRQYIYDGIFTRPRCLELAKKYRLHESKLKIDPSWAADEIRDAIDVEVTQNYFMADYLPPGLSRAATIRITYTGKDPDEAWAVVRELGRFVREHEAQNREHVAAVALQQVERWQDSERRKLTQLKQGLLRTLIAIEGTRGDAAGRLRVQRDGLQREIDNIEQRLSEMAQVSRTFRLQRAIERHQLGLSFSQIDWARPPPPIFSTTAQLIVLAVALLLLLLPLVALGIGALDSRVFTEEDIRRLGMRPISHVPAFPGCAEGTMNDRLQGKWLSLPNRWDVE